MTIDMLPLNLARLRAYSQTALGQDIRTRLSHAIKEAMKARDSFTSTALRSVLSDIHAADKAAKEPVSLSVVLGVIRKAAARRTDAAMQYTKADRPELADHELQEVELLSAFLPPLMTAADIDEVLRQVIQALPSAELPSKSTTGKILKGFYAKVEKAAVDPQMVHERLTLLLKHSKT